MNVRIMRLLLVFSFLSAAYSFLNGHHLSLPCGYYLRTSDEDVLARSTVNKRACRPNSALVMATKLSDKDKNKKSKEDESGGVGRFIAGIFRNEKDEEPEEDEDEGGFFKSMSTRLSFRRESESGRVGGFQVSGDPIPLISFPLRSSGEVGNSEAGEQKYRNDTDKRLQKLFRKQMESNRKRQKKIEEQKRSGEEQEKEAKKQVEKISNEIAKLKDERRKKEELGRKKKVELEARKKEELEKKKKVELEARKKEELERKKREELEKKKKELEKQKKAQVTRLELSSKKNEDSEEEEKEKKRTSTTSVFMKFVSNVGKNAVKAFQDEEEWVVVLPKTRLSPGEIVPVHIRGIDLLVVGSRDGKIHCLANSCPHLGTPLETGLLESRPKEDADANMMLTSTLPPRIDSEDCIVCPLHRTAFALESGEVRGEWCPYPPVIGNIMGSVKAKSPAAVFDIRTRGKNIEVRINSLLQNDGESSTPKPNS